MVRVQLLYRLRRIRVWTIVKLCIIIHVCLFLIYAFHTDQLGSSDVDKGKRKAVSDGPVFVSGVLGNYEPKDLPPRSGPGEYGEGVVLSKEDGISAQPSISDYGFNMVASDQVALDRYIKDTRHDECKYWHYPKELPTVSVVLVVYNEPWSIFIRTIHSVINTSPKHLLKEVIIVDDMSSKAFLKEELDRYCEQTWPKRFVTIIHTEKREGLITARTIGAKHATADVVVFLDAHCECVVNWLPPLLTRIVVNRRAVAVPIVDQINWNTMEHSVTYGSTQSFRGIWEWGFLYKEKEVPAKELTKHNRSSEPYWSPTHAGGLLAIEREWFFELGGYDPGLKIWGGEQYELSFKTWQFGGVVEWVPCSRVAHYYRGPRVAAAGGPDVAMISAMNHMRVAEVWMDEYKEYFYRREPWHKYHYISKLGDVSERKAVRERLRCKPFRWFMENVAYDMTDRFAVPPENRVWGELTCAGKGVCVNTMGKLDDYVGVFTCPHSSRSQRFRLNVKGEWSKGEHCLISQNGKVFVRMCVHGDKWTPEGEWDYDDSTQLMKSTSLNQCLETNGGDLLLAACDGSNVGQRWKWNRV